ncbi:ABC transporter substrate-binding protein [Alkalibacter mobilis]|uniref:ABC transporter substrate-binding protein n=1 Tax=Alkalibacter mobilis TaxID=2787712 RepID=UPI001CECE46C|nr:ABC transporter substrate-binding protein [Alkalibacter mobilis]
MKKKFLKIAVALMLVASVFAFAACGGGDEAETIKIGVFGPLSGEVASYGTAVVDSVKLAVEEINAAGGVDGKMIEIFDYDTKADKAEAVNIYNRLKDQDEVVAIIGGTISGETLAVKELAIADNMPMLTPTATSADVTIGAPSIFRACFLDPYQGSAAAAFSIESLEAKSVAVLYNSDDAYSEGIAEAYKAAVEEAGLEVVYYDAYTSDVKDFNTYLTQIKSANPDVIFLPDYYNRVGLIATQMRDLGIEQTAVGVDGWDSVEIDYAEQVEGYYFVNHFAKDDPDAIVQNFIATFKENYDKDPNALGALGYDATYIMVEAIKNAGSTDAQAIIDALAEVEYTGVTGPISFNDEGDADNKNIAIIKIVDGKHVLEEKISAK